MQARANITLIFFLLQTVYEFTAGSKRKEFLFQPLPLEEEEEVEHPSQEEISQEIEEETDEEEIIEETSS